MRFSVLVICFLSITACEKPDSAPRGDTPPRVVCTIGMIGDIAARIGGKHVEVQTLMGAGIDPHLYKPSQGDIRKLNEAQLILFNGLHLEGKMAQVLSSLAKDRPVVAVAETLPEMLLIKEDPHAVDPHVWMDASLWAQTLAPITEALSVLLPSHRESFEAEEAKLRNEIIDLDEWIEEQINSIPATQRVLITAHDAFGYFGRRYTIEVMSLQGISTLDEASIQDVQRLSDTIIQKGVRAIFVESSIPKRTLQAVQVACRDKGHKVEFGGELFTDALGELGTEEGTYLGMMRHNVSTIAGALK